MEEGKASVTFFRLSSLLDIANKYSLANPRSGKGTQAGIRIAKTVPMKEKRIVDDESW